MDESGSNLYLYANISRKWRWRHCYDSRLRLRWRWLRGGELMRTFCLSLMLACGADAANLLVNQPGTPVATGTWVGPITVGGYPIKIVGYSNLECAAGAK